MITNLRYDAFSFSTSHIPFNERCVLSSTPLKKSSLRISMSSGITDGDNRANTRSTYKRRRLHFGNFQGIREWPKGTYRYCIILDLNDRHESIGDGLFACEIHTDNDAMDDTAERKYRMKEKIRSKPQTLRHLDDSAACAPTNQKSPLAEHDEAPPRVYRKPTSHHKGGKMANVNISLRVRGSKTSVERTYQYRSRFRERQADMIQT